MNEAIDRGAAWLKQAQKPNGTWGDRYSNQYDSGVAALGFLTLVKSGVGEADPAVQRSIRYFDDYRAFEKTYSTGVLSLAWEALKRGSTDRPRVEAAAKWLMEHRDPATKLWAYPDGDVDLSNTQYALLGLHAAWRMGVAIPQQYLFESLQAVVKRQQKESSFTYKDPNDVGTGSMTTAAIFAMRVGMAELKGFAPTRRCGSIGNRARRGRSTGSIATSGSTRTRPATRRPARCALGTITTSTASSARARSPGARSSGNILGIARGPSS